MADFHFIRPLWLTAIIGLVLAIYLLKRIRISQSGWHQLLPVHLSKVLVDGKQHGQSLSLTLPFIIGLLSIVALAGPTWKKLPQPVYQVAQGSVVIMDMSYSMYATDLTPNRLTRARYKAIDLLNTIQEGDVGLIAYAGDAFVISPLTEDVNNIKLLLPSLTPDLMPELGSNPLSALTLADEMLKNAGHVDGNIYWFTDGIDNEDIQDINEWSQEHPYHLNVMGVGTTAGAPIKLTNGELMKDDNGAIIIPKLPQAALNGVAKRGSGNFVKLSNSDDDISRLTHQPLDIKNDKKTASENAGDQWQEFGPYLLLLVLPLVLSYFRRGALLAVIPVIFILTPAKPLYAAESQVKQSQPVASQDSGNALWDNLWKTKDQQGQQSFNNQKFEAAAQQFKDPLWQGSAHYQAGNYEDALSAFQQSDSAEALYNQGNALARLQQLDQAIEAYDKAIAKAPNHNDAKANKALIEQLKQQQEQQNQDNDQNQDQNQDKDQQENQDQNQDSQQDSQQDKQGEQDQQQDQDNQQEQDSQKDQQQDSQKDSEKESQQDQQSDQDQDAEQDEQSGQEKKEQEQSKAEQEQSEQEQAQAQQAKASEEQLDKETQQKHQQLLNKVTDDPYLLLRNKMQLEYQKRRQNRSSLGDKKKW